METPIKVSPPGKIGPYVIREEVGRGKTSIVYRAIDQTTQENVAIKIVPKQQFRNQAEMSKFQNEVSLLFRCHHPNVLFLINLLQDSLNFYMVTELCDQDLEKFILSNGKLCEKDAKFVFKQIIEAMSFVNDKGIAHRDVKLENVLIDLKNNGRIVLSDFGFSLLAQDKASSHVKCGTIAYIAPEVLNGDQYNPFLSDVWSAGILLYALITQTFPWPTTSEEDMVKHIQARKISFPDYLSKEVIDLINQMTNIIPSKRPSFKKIMHHQWISDINLPVIESKTLLRSQPNFYSIREVFRSNFNQRVVFNRNIHPVSSCFYSKKMPEGNEMKSDVLNVLQKSHRRAKLKNAAKRKTFPILNDDLV